MQTRVNFYKTAPEAYTALMDLSKFIATTPLDPVHQELIKIRASQINGCAYCINMHTAEARKNGETEQRIYLLNAWREADVFTDAEKALLAFTEEVTRISNHVSDETYANAAKYFDEKYMTAIIMMIIVINSWNRMVISTGVRVS